MKKMFTKRLLTYMIAALTVTMVVLFVFQTILTNRSNINQSREKLQTVKEKLEGNDEEIERLTNNLGENNLAKSRAFADMLAEDPSILDSQSKLNEICERLMVNELHVIDDKGIITHSTVEAYIGFDMGSGEQSAAFLKILDKPSMEIVQEPQENAAEGIIIQYIGVARKDAKGVVQVGIRPEILEKTLASTEIDKVLADVDYGKKGYVFAIDPESENLLAHPDEELIGTSAKDAGFKIQEKGGKGWISVSGVRGFYETEPYGDILIGTFMPSGEYYSTRTSQMIVVCISLFVVFMVLLYAINTTVDKRIVSGINRLEESMQQIAGGNFDITVEETGSPEFVQMSQYINTMVESIRHNMERNDHLLEQQQSEMENNVMLIDHIKQACKNLESVSSATVNGADEIYQGTEEQKKAVYDLENVLNELANDLHGSADETVKVISTTEMAVEKLRNTQNQMGELSASINNISEISQQIESIIDEINSIAGQTNLLALNASIEAARAGESGRGFAVVATQVGELAMRCAQAARETNDLITSSIHAVDGGKEIARSTAHAFDSVVEVIGAVDKDVEQIAGMVRQNAKIVEQAVDEIHRIENVVDTNIEISHNSKQISNDMGDITSQLMGIVQC